MPTFAFRSSIPHLSRRSIYLAPSSSAAHVLCRAFFVLGSILCWVVISLLFFYPLIVPITFICSDHLTFSWLRKIEPYFVWHPDLLILKMIVISPKLTYFMLCGYLIIRKHESPQVLRYSGSPVMTFFWLTCQLHLWLLDIFPNIESQISSDNSLTQVSICYYSNTSIKEYFWDPKIMTKWEVITK